MERPRVASADRPARGRRVAAWLVHAVTASGLVWGLLGLTAAAQGEWRATFVWLFVACVVDSVDGMLARRVGVDVVTPSFDGRLLDNLVDYVTYVLVPAFALATGGVLPPSLALAGGGLVCLAAAYQFCQTEAKTADHFFQGFPSYWNVAALYLFVAGLAPTLNLLIVVALAGMSFVPLRWIYPSRMPRWRRRTVALTIAWGVAVLAMLVLFPSPPGWLVAGSLAYVVYYVGVSLWLQRAAPARP